MNPLTPGAPRAVVAVLDDWEGRWAASPAVSALRAVADVRIFSDRFLGVADLSAAAGDARVLVLNRERTRVDSSLLAALPNLNAIVNTGSGLNHVNRAAVEARGIALLSTGGTSRAVAEQTFALMLAAVKQIPQLDRGVRYGRFALRPLVGDLYGKRLGLVGLGRIGLQVARIARCFGMSVTAWSPHLRLSEAAELGLARADSLLELAGASDILSLHLRLTPETREIVSAQVVAALPEGAIFVNTARAELVDAEALIARAERGELSVALDVFEDEPDIDPRYRSLPGVLSPHVGWKSAGTWDEFITAGIACIEEALTLPAPAVQAT